MRKTAMLVFVLAIILSANLAFAAGTSNASLNYVWNGTQWIPWLATSDGKPYVYLDLVNVTSNNLTVNYRAGIGTSSPAYPLDVSGAGRFSGNLYLGTAGRYVYDTGSIVGVSSGLSLGGNLDMGGNSIVSGAWLNATSINATGIYGATLYEGGTSLAGKYALQATSISSGSGLSGGGDLSATRTLSIANSGVTNIMIAANSVNKTQISGVLDSTVVGSLYGENITQGTIDSARISGVYSGITGLGIQAQNLDMGGNNITKYNYLAANDSSKLNGQAASYYLDTSSTAQTKSGSLIVTGAWLNATNLNVSSNAYFGGNVGIGTTAPSYALEVNGDAKATNLRAIASAGSAPVVQVSNGVQGINIFAYGPTSQNIIQATGDYPLRIDVNSNEKMRILSNGNVGIGTTNPTEQLHVAKNGNISIYLNSRVSGTDDTFTSSLLLGGYSSNWFIRKMGSANSHRLDIGYNTGSESNFVTILDSGNVGIGTANPQNTLNVVGDANITGDFLYGCPNTATNQMVKVGSFCIDKYEAYTVSGSLGNANGNNTNAVAGSKSGVAPQASVTWFQAAQECANAGKRLCTNAEWQTAVAGTPDPGADGGATGCNVASSGTPANTGAHSACVSRWGAYDMVGNVWEWVADWGQAGWTWQTSDGQYTNTAWPDATYGADGTWNVNGRTYNGAAWASGAPAAFIRGGYWADGADAGSFALGLLGAPSASGAGIGFRCCK